MAYKNRYCYLLLVMLSIFLLTVLAGCRRTGTVEQTGDYQIVLLGEPSTAVGQTELQFLVTDGVNEPVDGLSLNVKGDMTHAGMVPVVRDANQSEEGLYIVPWEWTMRGDWIVTVTAVDAAQKQAQARFDLSIR